MELNLTPRWKKEVKLIMLSGGIDSAYLLYKRLTETDWDLHAHHINFLVPGFPRHDAETKASRSIRDYLYKIRPFSYTETTIDFSNLGYTGWDTDTQLFVGARVAASLTASKVTLELGINADDISQDDIQERIKRGILPNLWSSLLSSFDDHYRNKVNSEISFPLKKISKQEILTAMPQELIDLTWSCREPVRENGQVRACGECHACKQLVESNG